MDNLAPAPWLRLKRFSSADEFEPARNLNVNFTPLQVKITAANVTFSLPGCDVTVVHSFPRLSDGSVRPNRTLVGFLMDEGAPVRFNGVDGGQCTIVIGSGGAEYSLTEHTSRQLAMISFHPEIRDRGWPTRNGIIGGFRTSPSAYRRLQRLVSEMISTAQTSADPSWHELSSFSLRESLLTAVDAACDDMADGKWLTGPNAIGQFKIFKAIESAIASDLGRPIYSEELAGRVGISIRTLHNVVQRYRGMSLHKYLRLRRLWLVRQQLLAGTTSVKVAALTFGFWHLSDFSGSYRALFGELPSETLTRAR
jgi:AraC family ethanolamine operon transcriptional activator